MNTNHLSLNFVLQVKDAIEKINEQDVDSEVADVADTENWSHQEMQLGSNYKSQIDYTSFSIRIKLTSKMPPSPFITSSLEIMGLLGTPDP